MIKIIYAFHRLSIYEPKSITIVPVHKFRIYEFVRDCLPTKEHILQCTYKIISQKRREKLSSDKPHREYLEERIAPLCFLSSQWEVCFK